MTTTNEIVAALSTNLLNKAYVEKERANLVHVAKSSREAAEREVIALEERFAAEAPLRAIRDLAAKHGFRRSDYDAAIWIRKNKITGRWDKFTVEQVARAIVD